jgi:hypothetical protein
MRDQLIEANGPESSQEHVEIALKRRFTPIRVEVFNMRHLCVIDDVIIGYDGCDL